MAELINTKRWKDEHVADYINCLRLLNLDCKDRWSKILTIEICIKGIYWSLSYTL